MGYKRFGNRIDSNQNQIVSALRAAGREVLDLSDVGRGCPDLLVSNEQDMWLMEVKNPEYIPKKPVKGSKLDRIMTEKQKKFYAQWKGKPILVVSSIDEALEKTRWKRRDYGGGLSPEHYR